MNIGKDSVRAMLFVVLLLACVSLVAPSQAQSYAEVDYLNIDVHINDGYAVTTVEEKLGNRNNFSITDRFEILIPENAFMSGLSIIIDGKEYQADILKKEEAQERFEEAASSGRTAGLLETRDTELFTYSLNFEANQSIIVKLTYEQALTRTMDEYEYLQYLRSNREVGELSVTVDISSSTDVLSVTTPDLISDITYPDSNSAKVSFSSTGLPGKDMKVVFTTENTDIEGKMLFYEINGSGYFMHVFSPTASELGTSPLNKDIIFVIDKSGSMEGLKIQQVRTVFSQIIEDLSEGDRFNVVFFDFTVRPHSNEIMVVNYVNKGQAVATVINVTADGGTNINEALTRSLGMFYNASTNVPIVVFLTDGMPTEGVISTAIIRKNVIEANKVNASIFSIAFGEENDYDFNFLQALSLENKGIAVYFEADSEASAGISDFYETISTPLVSDLMFSYDGTTSDTVLSGKEHLFVGSESIVLGRYEGNTDLITAGVNGRIRSGEYSSEHVFTVKSSEGNDFIPRLWAYNTIRSKLNSMKVVGETDELVGDVTTLSLEYGFVTPYTSFFVEIPQAESPEEEVEEAVEWEEGEVVEESLEWMEEEEAVELEYSEEVVEEEGEAHPEGLPGFGIVLAISAIGGGVMLLRRMK